jgi:hypothetical protein
MLLSCASTVVELLPHYTKVKGSSLTRVADNRSEKMAKVRLNLLLVSKLEILSNSYSCCSCLLEQTNKTF